MQTKLSPYDPITPELAARGLLIPIKQAAENNECCEGTLKDNAKARRLPAYQSHFGAPVMVLPNEVGEFLVARPDIASKYHPKISPAVPSAGLPVAPSTPQVHSLSPFPDAEGSCGPIGDLGVGITLRSLNHCQPAEIGLVANTLIEIGHQLLDLLPPQPTHTNH